MDTTIKFGALVLGTMSLATIFGMYLARLITFEARPLDNKLLGRETCGFIILNRINKSKQMVYQKNFDPFINDFANNQRSSINNQQFIRYNLIY